MTGTPPLLAPGEQIVFRAAAAEIVEDLVRRAVPAIGYPPELFHVRRVEVAHAPVADVAGPAQRLEGIDGLGQWVAAAPVEEVEVDPVGAEPLQTPGAGGGDAFSRRVVRVDLADDEDFVPPAGRGLAHHLLGPALGVHLSCVDQRHAEIEPVAKGGHLGGALVPPLAHVPGALAEGRDSLAVGEGDVAHG
jgi:hypothetical protein